MIAPVNRRRCLDAGLRKPFASGFEVSATYGKSMMRFAQRMGNTFVALLGAEWRAFDLEEGEILRSTLKKRLIAQVGDHAQPQHLGIEALGRA